jgi:hypothetical protein
VRATTTLLPQVLAGADAHLRAGHGWTRASPPVRCVM